MTDNITPIQPEFSELCKSLGVEYPSSIHHFEKDAVGIYRPVEWAYPLKEKQ